MTTRQVVKAGQDGRVEADGSVADRGRGMTFRALALGVLFALLLALGGHFNDHYMQQTYAVGNFLPISVIGLLLVLVLVVRPLSGLFFRRRAFSGAEVALIILLPLAVCVVPGSGFLRTFTYTLVMPEHYEKTQPSWQRNAVLSYVPTNLLVRTTPANQEKVLGGFLQGNETPQHHARLSDVPWRAWMPALLRWVPLFGILMLGLIGFSLVLHRQWTTHEHLIYPIAEFVKPFTRDDGGAFPAAVANRVFWYGCLPILLVHVVNGLHAWFPSFIQIPHRIDLWSLREFFPNFASVSGASGVFGSTIFFSVVAFAFFLPSDIALSLGLSTLVGAFFGMVCVTYGVNLTGDWSGAGEVQGLLFGAYLGLFAMVLYSGRAYYGRVIAAAFGRHAETPLEPSATWGFRLFLLSCAASVILIMRMGLPWLYAVLLVGLLVIMFTVMSRVCAETGLFFLLPTWQPIGVLIGLFGAAALGPGGLIVIGLVCAVISIDPREAMMPFIVNGLRIAEDVKLPRGRVAGWMGGTLLFCLVAGVAAALWMHYDRGANLSDSWGTYYVPMMPFNLLDKHIQAMMAEGIFDTVRTADWVQRLSFFHPDGHFLCFTFLGLGFYAFFALLRLRFARWPLHPVLFICWMTYPMMCFSTSFLIGWAVKALVVRFGGGGTYQRMKPFMVGMVAGDLLGGLIFMVAGSIYSFCTGFPPVKYGIFPG